MQVGNSLISIIVPVYNAERFLKECIESILNQTYAEIELLLIDDGSSDSSGEICDAYAKTDSRIRVEHQENKGVSAARNLGIDLSQGEYIIFVDADDVVGPYMVERYLSTLENTGADICISECTGKLENISNPGIQFPTAFSAKEALHNTLALGISNMGPVTKIIRRSALEGLYFPSDIKFAEDQLFNIQLFTSVTKIAYLPECHYYYRYSPEWSTTSKKFEEKIKTALTAFDEMEKIILNKMPDLIYDVKRKKTRLSLRIIDIMIKLQIPASNSIFQEFHYILRKNKKMILTDSASSMKTKCGFVLFLIFPSAYIWIKCTLYKIKGRS